MNGKHNIAPRRIGSRRRGFTLAEVMLSLVVFAMMALMFGAVFPMSVRGAQYSGNYTQAVGLAQHKLDQLRAAGYTQLFAPTGSTGLISRNLINAVNPDDTPQLRSYDFTTSDALVSDGVTRGYYPLGSRGTVTVAPYTSGGVPAGSLAWVTVTISWTGGGVSNGSVSVSALVAKAAP